MPLAYVLGTVDRGSVRLTTPAAPRMAPMRGAVMPCVIAGSLAGDAGCSVAAWLPQDGARIG